MRVMWKYFIVFSVFAFVVCLNDINGKYSAIPKVNKSIIYVSGQYLEANKTRGVVVCAGNDMIKDIIGYSNQLWFVWKSSNSVLSLSILNFARLIPALFIGYLGGYLCDKYNPKKILISLYITTLTLNIILFILISLNEFHILFISALVFIKGIFSEMEPAVRNSYLPFLVPPQFIYSAVSLYSTVLNISGVLGPAIAGYALIKLSPNYLYLTQVIGQIIILISILYLPIKYLKMKQSNPYSNQQES